MVQKSSQPWRWEGVEVMPYKEDGGTHFKSITRQTLFQGGGNLPVEFRYFEVGPGGHSTLERHEHQHAVMIIRGSGQVFVGNKITNIGLHDVVHIPPMTWHQFHAAENGELGFLCIVACDRDRPQRPTPEDMVELRGLAGDFLRI